MILFHLKWLFTLCNWSQGALLDNLLYQLPYQSPQKSILLENLLNEMYVPCANMPQLPAITTHHINMWHIVDGIEDLNNSQATLTCEKI